MNWSAAGPSSLITKCEPGVDGGTTATAAGNATSDKATPALGSHQVHVRATQQSGKSIIIAYLT
ncbi:hypothetical protein [Streptomyces sp. NPDC000878]